MHIDKAHGLDLLIMCFSIWLSISPDGWATDAVPQPREGLWLKCPKLAIQLREIYAHIYIYISVTKSISTHVQLIFLEILSFWQERIVKWDSETLAYLLNKYVVWNHEQPA